MTSIVELKRHQSEKHKYSLCADFFHQLYFLTSGKSLKLPFNILFFPTGKQKENALLKVLNHRIMKWLGVKMALKI